VSGEKKLGDLLCTFEVGGADLVKVVLLPGDKGAGTSVLWKYRGGG